MYARPHDTVIQRFLTAMMHLGVVVHRVSPGLQDEPGR